MIKIKSRGDDWHRLLRVVLGHRGLLSEPAPPPPPPTGGARRHPLNSDHAYTENRTHPAAQLLITAAKNIDRLHNEGAFAALCGASPIPVASGQRGRHRLSPGGDRQANRALHMIAVCCLRHCPDTRAYAERRTTEGKTKKEIIGCLKRHIARQAYAIRSDDLRSLPT